MIMIRNMVKKREALAAVITIISLMLFLLSDPLVSIAGDVNISKFIATNIHPGFFFISPALAAPLQLLAHAFPGINWWAFFSIVSMFVSEYIILLYVQIIAADDKRGKQIAIILACAIWLMFYLEGINFTQTATLLAVAGNCAVLALCNTARAKENVVRIVIAVLLYIIAGALRWEAMILCIPFLIMVIVYRLFVSYCGSKDVKSGVGQYKVRVIACVAVILVAICSKGIHNVYEMTDPVLKEGIAASKYRSDIFDYKDRYPDYETNQELYQNAGVDGTWLNMVFACFTSDTNNFSSDQLYKVTLLREKSVSTIVDYIKTLKSHADSLLVIAILVVFIFISVGFKRNLVPFLLCSATVVFAVAFFIKMGRFPWRVSNAFLINALVSGIAMTSENDEERGEGKIKWLIACGVVAITLVSILARRGITLPASRATNSRDVAVMDYMDEHKENVYFTRYNFYYAWNIFTPKKYSYLDNHFDMESNFISGRTEDKAKYGITDIVMQMISEPGIHTVYFPVWHEYLRTYYDDNVSAGVVETVPGTDVEFIRYCVPVTADNLSASSYCLDITVEPIAETASDEYSYYAVNADIDSDDYDYYYLNVSDEKTGELYTYPLICENNKLSGKIIRVNDSWGDASDYSIIAARKDGEQYSYEVIEAK